ncbi:MAG: hypothetical protein ABH877_00110 [bacterium]
MKRRKTIIAIAAAAVLTLAIAGSAYAATAGEKQGYQGGRAVTGSTGVGTGSTCPDCGERDQKRDRAGDGSCDGTCDGAGPQGTAARNAGAGEAGPAITGQDTSPGAAGSNGAVNGAAVQQQDRAREWADPALEQTQTRSQKRQHDGSCEGSGK